MNVRFYADENARTGERTGVCRWTVDEGRNRFEHLYEGVWVPHPSLVSVLGVGGSDNHVEITDAEAIALAGADADALYEHEAFYSDAQPRDEAGRWTDGGGSYVEGVPASAASMFKEDRARGIKTRGVILYEKGTFDDHVEHVRAAMKAAGYRETNGMLLELDGIEDGAELQYVKGGKELNVYMRNNGRVTALTADETPMDSGGRLHTTDNFIPQHLHDTLLPSRKGKKFGGEFEESKHPRDERGRWTDGESMYESHAQLPAPMRDVMTRWSDAAPGFDALRAAGPDTLFWTTLEEMPSYTGAAFRGTILSDAELKALTDGKEFNVSLHSSWSKDENVAHEEFLKQAGDLQRMGAGRAVLIELESHGGVRDVENFVAPSWKDQREVISPIGLRLERVGGVTKGTMRGPDGKRFEFVRLKVREVPA